MRPTGPTPYPAAMSLGAVLLVLAGLIVLVGGGEVLVRGASNIATALGLSPLIVGLTVVAFATSAPEFAVTTEAVLGGNPGLAVGNIAGSNIANILLVLGVAAVILPLAVKSSIVRLDLPVMIGMSVLVTVFAFTGVIVRWQGAVLFLGLIGYLVWVIMIARSKRVQESELLEPAWNEGVLDGASTEEESPSGEAPQASAVQSEGATTDGASESAGRPWGRLIVNLILVALGVLLLVLGAHWLVQGAVEIASGLGVSDVVIGLTVVAIGTSLPELATAIVATIRGERDLAIGNVVGSNIFNIGAVLGVAALIAPDGIPVPASAAHFDFIIMTAVAVLLLPIAYTGRVIARWEGWLFLGYYAAYIIYLVLASGDHDALEPFSIVMLLFVVPITVVFLITTVVAERQSVGRRKQRRQEQAVD